MAYPIGCNVGYVGYGRRLNSYAKKPLDLQKTFQILLHIHTDCCCLPKKEKQLKKSG